jgi:MerR family transcriptional regulator, light-induced transcriptional regulator
MDMMIDERPQDPVGFGSNNDSSGPNENTSTVAQIAQLYREAALRGDRSEALRIIVEAGPAAGLSVSELYLGVIQATQYEIGKMWEDGDVTVSQEHVSTGISQLAIARLYSMMPRNETAGHRVVITCVPGETHDMGPRVLADFFEMAGFDVRYLGADVPVDEIVDAVRRWSPSLVALSATMSYNLPAFRDTVNALRKTFGEDVLIAAGGQAFELTPELLDELDIEVRARDARQLVESSREVLNRRSATQG